MRNVLLFGLAVLVLTCTATAYGVGFTAYNDFNIRNSSVPSTTTTWGAPTGPGNSGLLIDAGTNTATGVTLTLSSTGGPGTGDYGSTVEFAAGTPAALAFGSNIVNRSGTNGSDGRLLQYASGAWTWDLTFSGLNPAYTYTLVTTNDRGDYAANYTDRWSKITMDNPDGLATEVTTGGEFHCPGGGFTMPSTNTATGYIAEWTGITAGADGIFMVHFAPATNAADRPAGAGQNGNRGYGPSGLMLQENVPEPSTLVLLLVAGGLGWAATAYRRRK